MLGPVERAVGEGDDFFIANVGGESYVPRESRPANRDGAMQRKASAFDLERFAGHGGEDAGGESGGFFAFTKTGDHQEFFAAPADQDIGITDGGADAGGEVDEHLIAGIVAEAVVDFFEMVRVYQIENDVAIAAAARGIGRGIRANRLAHIALDGGLEKAAVARGGERIGERHFLELFVRLCERFATFCDRLFETEALALQLARPVVHEVIKSEDAEKNGETARIPALPPRRDYRES